MNSLRTFFALDLHQLLSTMFGVSVSDFGHVNTPVTIYGTLGAELLYVNTCKVPTG